MEFSTVESSAFHRLDERIQRWIWEQKWIALKDVQERAIPLILENEDVVIAAATSSGKTEATYFPLLTRLLKLEPPALAIYIGPLKALINDQWQRLTGLCQRLEIPITPWHGDINATQKRRFEKNPTGCLLITPESLEGLLLRNGHALPALFRGLQTIVIDELHAFMGSVRGKQLQSLMHRIEFALGRRVARIGLSATLGDMRLARAFLRPLSPADVQLIESRADGRDLKVIVKGVYEASAPIPDPLAAADSVTNGGIWTVADDLFRLRGHNNLVFPNSRRNVEILADRLRELSLEERVPNEFWPHHGSLAKALREEAESTLKRGEVPATAIATTTLELGIDVGSVKSVAQVGAAPSVASLRQRLGRSGRRPGEPAILRSYCIEAPLDVNSPLSDELRQGLVETIAQIRLLTRHWYEPPLARDLHLSTLVQQLLSLIGQYSGLRATDAWRLLFESQVFTGLAKSDFAGLLRHLADVDVLMQDATGLLLHAPGGERLVNHYSFLAAFMGDEEFRVVTAGKTLGSLPLSRPIVPGTYIIFGGKRWCVLDCRAAEKILQVEPARSGQVPKFDGGGGKVHDEVRREMRAVLSSEDVIPFIDATATEQLKQARASYARLDLDENRFLDVGDEVRILTWRGDFVNDTIAVWLDAQNLRASNEGLYVSVIGAPLDRVLDAILDLGECPVTEPGQFSRHVRNLVKEKWDWLVPEELLRKGFEARELDIAGAQELCRELSGL